MIKIATRGSKLALTQANMVANLLGQESEIYIIKTTGDIKSEEPLKHLGGKEVFTKEIDEALLSGSADIAVHSLKDVAGIIHPELEIIACLPREDARDILLGAESLDALKQGAKIGTSSPRRKAQLLNLRPDLEVVEFRGNVETRIKKLQDGIVDGTILAAAGINRLQMKLPVKWGYLEGLIPAVGQGIICVMARKEKFNLDRINHQPSFIAAVAERAALAAFGGNCYTPIAAHATINGKLKLAGFIASEDGKKVFTTSVEGAEKDARKLGDEMGKKLLSEYGKF